MFSCGNFCSVQKKENDTVTVVMPHGEEEREAGFDIVEAEEASSAAEEVQVEEALAAKFVDKWVFFSEEVIALQSSAAVTQWKQQTEEQELARRQEEERLAKELQEQAAAREAARQVEEAAEEARKKAEEESERQAAAAKRKAAVQAFLKEHGYSGVSAPKKTFLKTTYPLHEAAKRADAVMVKMLLDEGASKAQKNSRGKTATQRAQQADRKGSHAEVIQLLGGKTGKAGGA